MAIINLTPSRVGLQAPAPAMQPQGDPVGAALADFGATLNDLAKRDQQARDADQAATARSNYATGLVELRVRAERGELGPDIRGGFEQAAAQLRADTAAGIASATSPSRTDRTSFLTLQKVPAWTA